MRNRPSPQTICRTLRPVGWKILDIVLALILGEVAIRLTSIKFAVCPQKPNSDGHLAWRTLLSLLPPGQRWPV